MHFKQKEYYYCGIALPLSEFIGRKEELTKFIFAYDANTPDGEEVARFQLYVHKGIMLVDKETPHVVYQSEVDYNSEKVWIREVEDFFGYKQKENGELVKRFTLIK